MKEGENTFHVAVDSTLRAALIRKGLCKTSEAFTVSSCDLHKKLFKRPVKKLIVFVVDSSDSMGQGAFARMQAAKGAVLAILSKAHLGRHRVALVAFRDESAELVLQPTSSISLARSRLKALPTGGATPLADGLIKAWWIVKTERIKDPQIKPLLVILSDGEANVPHDPGLKYREVEEELLRTAQRIGKERIHSIVIDTKRSWEKPGEMLRVAQALEGVYHHINRIKARDVIEFVTAF